MASVSVTVTIDVKGLKGVQNLLRNGSASPVRRAMFNQWAARYSTFTRRRFERLSRGGGEWPPLAPSTIAKRRTGGKFRKYGQTRADAVRDIKERLRTGKGRTGRATLLKDLKHLTSGAGVAILRDTGILFNAITIGQYGNLTREIPDGVRYGFSQTPHGVNKLTIARIAGYHQTGGKNLPRRTIIVKPDVQTVNGMMLDVRNAVLAAAKAGAT